MKTPPNASEPQSLSDSATLGLLTELEFGKRYRARDRRTVRAYARDLGIRPLLVGCRRFYRIIDILRAEEKEVSRSRIH